MQQQNRIFKWSKSLAKNLAVMLIVITAIGLYQTRGLPGNVPKLSLKQGAAGDLVVFPPKNAIPSVTLVYVFAPWCGVCKLSMPNLETLRKKMPDMRILPLALDYESAEDVAGFIKESGYSGTYFSGDAAVRDALGITAYPTYLVIGADGSVKASSIGYSTQLGMIIRVLWAQFLS